MTILSRALNAMQEAAKKTDSYWAERAKLDFSMELERRRRAADLSYSDVAKRIETSPAYVTKVFRGDSNLTIETMVKLARATGGHLELRIVEEVAEPRHWSIVRTTGMAGSAAQAASSVTFTSNDAANASPFAWGKLAA